MIRRLSVIAALAVLGGGCTAASARAAAAPSGCAHRILILSAMPLELNPLISRAAIDPSRTVRIDDRVFYSGKLGGGDVVLALTGIGVVNAQQTAKIAFDSFGCTFAAALFSGDAGSGLNIGDVAVPGHWTLDAGHTWTDVDRSMLTVARQLEGNVPLAQDVPGGDAACLCPGVDASTSVHVPHKPKVVAGGPGVTTDPFGGKAVPCVPGGGDIAGCAPCLLPSGSLQDAAAFADHAPSLVDPNFLRATLQPPAAASQADAQDEETAAVAQLASAHRVPFLGIRGVSDGAGDPLHLPGFPAEFFVYRQLAANNAAAVTLAFLRRWVARPEPAGSPVSRRGPRRPHVHRHRASRSGTRPSHARRHRTRMVTRSR